MITLNKKRIYLFIYFLRAALTQLDRANPPMHARSSPLLILNPTFNSRLPLSLSLFVSFPFTVTFHTTSSSQPPF